VREKTTHKLGISMGGVAGERGTKADEQSLAVEGKRSSKHVNRRGGGCWWGDKGEARGGKNRHVKGTSMTSKKPGMWGARSGKGGVSRLEVSLKLLEERRQPGDASEPIRHSE